MDEDITKVLKHYHLQDLIPQIESFVYREEKQKQKIHGLIKKEFIKAIGSRWCPGFLNPDHFASFYLDSYIKLYGLFFDDFAKKYGQKIKEKFIIDLKERDEDKIKSEEFCKSILQDIIDDTYDIHEDYNDVTLSNLVYFETINSFDELFGSDASENLASSMNFWYIFIFTCLEEESENTFEDFISRYLYSTAEWDRFLHRLYRYILTL
jgi:hypothetical protein